MGDKWELDLLGEGDSIKDLINDRSDSLEASFALVNLNVIVIVFSAVPL